MKEEAKKLKNKLIAYMSSKWDFRPLSLRDDAFHNPIALAVNQKKIVLDESEHALIQQTRDSAKLYITHSNEVILKNYFTERQKVDDKLGNLYKTLSFGDFILRLWNKRFKEVYFDGRALVGREENASFSKLGTKAKKKLLQEIGTDKDTNDFYREYLTLEEAVLSPLVLPQSTSIVIGTGNRSDESTWNVGQECEQSIDVATVSYPAAAEFRDGNTTHYDLWFIVRPAQPHLNYTQQLELIQKNPALMSAAKAIYGPKLAFEKGIDADELEDFVWLKDYEGRPMYQLSKSAYIHRTKNVLKSVLLAADLQMMQDQLGTTFQLKGLGLGAFAFTHSENKKILEDLYLESVQAAIKDPDFQLRYITCINLINLPSDLANEAQFIAEPVPQIVPPSTTSTPVKQKSNKSNTALFSTIAAVSVCFVLAAVTLATAALTAAVALPVFISLAVLAVAAYKIVDTQKPRTLEKTEDSPKKSESEAVQLDLETLVPSVPKLASFLPEKPALRVIRRVMEPTKRDILCDIGGLVVCGDSGSKFGNEGNIGLTRSSSDDPAAQYSLLDPYILDADVNPILQKHDCVRILGSHGQSWYLESAPSRSSLSSSPTPKL